MRNTYTTFSLSEYADDCVQPEAEGCTAVMLSVCESALIDMKRIGIQGPSSSSHCLREKTFRRALTALRRTQSKTDIGFGRSEDQVQLRLDSERVDPIHFIT